MSDLQMVKGDTESFDVAVTRDEVAVNLTGAKAWFTAKKESADADADAVVKLNSVDNPTQVILSGVTGIIRVTLLPGDTNAYLKRWMVYDVQLKEQDGTVTTVARGKLEFLKQATISTT